MKPSLEQALLSAEPGDPVFAVWGDALVDAGEPRGTLVSLCRQLEKSPGDEDLTNALARLVAENADAWCRDCLDDEDALRLTWRDGFIDTVSYDSEPMEGDAGYEEGPEETDEGPGSALHRLITTPMAARISSLSLRCPIDAEGNHGCWGHHEVFVENLLRRDWPRLRALDFDGATLPRPPDHGRTAPQLSFLRFGDLHDAEITVGDLSLLWQRAPRLEHLVLAQPTGVVLGTVNAPRLRTLVFGSADSEALTAIAEGKLPSLETLVVRVEEPGDVAALLASKTLGPLKHLGLIATPSGEGQEERGEELLRVLLSSPRCEELETLDLGGLDATARGWQQLLAAAPRFKRLQSLRLTTWELDRAVARSDAWMEDSLEYLSDPHFAPRAQPIGKRLEAVLPVRWLTASIVSVVNDMGRKEGLFYGFFTSDGYAEHRG